MKIMLDIINIGGGQIETTISYFHIYNGYAPENLPSNKCCWVDGDKGHVCAVGMSLISLIMSVIPSTNGEQYDWPSKS